MPRLRQLLAARHRWFEAALQDLAVLDGYGDLSAPMVQMLSHIGRDPVRIGEIARAMQVSRQWVQKLAKEGEQLGLLSPTVDPKDRRALCIGFSEDGWRVVRLAAARMEEIERELEGRIGEKALDALMDILGTDWGEPKVANPRPSSLLDAAE
ncbi:MAG: MarR family winged helix-turn-helix transcriptional regulator [Pseudomonadota bacterium]